MVDHGAAGYLVLGGVVLAVTGAEALYADRGHFGASPIRLGWFGVALPGVDAQLPRPGGVHPRTTRPWRRTRARSTPSTR